MTEKDKAKSDWDEALYRREMLRKRQQEEMDAADEEVVKTRDEFVRVALGRDSPNQ